MRRRRSRSLVVLAAAVFGVPTLLAQDLGPSSRGGPAGSVGEADHAVVSRGGTGVVVGTGRAVFIDTGHIVVPRGVLAGAATAAVVVGGREQRVSAVIAEDRLGVFVLAAVDLPDGAPPAPKPSSALPSAELAVTVVAGDGVPRRAPLAAARQVPGIGLVRPLAAPDSGPLVDGSAALDARGHLAGVVVSRALGDGRRLECVIPAARLAATMPIAPLTVGDWGRQAAARAADDERARLRGASAILGGDLDSAAAAFEAAVAMDPASSDAWVALGECHRLRKRLDASAEAWRRAAAAQPGNARFHHELAVDLADAGDAAGAAQAFAEVARLRPSDAEARFNLGAALGTLGRHADEALAYQAALAIDPHHLRAMKNLALAYLDLQRVADAVGAFSRAAQLAPADPEVQTGLGIAYFRAHDVAAALGALRRALQIAPAFVKAHVSLGAVYVSTGDRASARAECEAVRALDPGRAAPLCRMVEGQ